MSYEGYIRTISSAMASGMKINFPGLNITGHMSERISGHKFGSPEYQWNPNLDRLYEAWQDGESANLADGGLIHCSVSAALVTKYGTVVIHSGKTSDTKPYIWGPPTELWRNESPLDEALAKLGKEILLRHEDQFVPMVFDGPKLEFGHIEQCAQIGGLSISKELVIPIRLMHDFPNTVHISFGEDFGANVLVSCEPETGRLGLIFLFEPVNPDSFDELTPIDGGLKDGEWSLRKVGYMSANNVRTLYLSHEAKLIAEALGYDK